MPTRFTVQIWRTWFWMGHYKHKSPKRTCLWSNSPVIAYFWRGKMTQKVRKMLKKKNPGFKPVKKYKDGKGKKRFHGTKDLTSTQILACAIMAWLFS